MRAGGTNQEQIDIEKDDLKKEKELLVKRKVDVLNKHIFPAMANLTVLIEKMQQNSYIREIFDDDVKALFLTKSRVNNNSNDRSIFQRFIEASSVMTMTTLMSTELGIEPKMPLPDYRLILCRIIQQSVFEAMRDIGPSKFDEPELAETMMVDMKLALAWTKEVSHKAWINEVSHGAGAKLHLQKKRRPALF